VVRRLLRNVDWNRSCEDSSDRFVGVIDASIRNGDAKDIGNEQH